MTAFVGMISKDFGIIGTDTLATYPLQSGDKQLRPRSYTCKTFLLPQFKSAFAATGFLQVGLCFFNLITEKALGIDIDSLTNIDLTFFQNKLKADYEQYPTGSLYLIGYSENQKCFKGYKLLVDLNTDLKWQEIPSERIIFRPIVDNWRDKLSKTGVKNDNCELITELMKIQKSEDDKKVITERVGIGGEVLCTQLVCNQETNGITMVSQLVHRFDDYLSLGNEMIQNRP